MKALKYQLAQSFLPKQPLPSSISFTKWLWNEGHPEDRQRIMKLVLERVWLSGENMVALWGRPQYLIWMREVLKDRAGEPVEPAQLPLFLLKEQKENGNSRLLESYRCGSNGHPSLITIWKLLVAPVTFLPKCVQEPPAV